MSSTSNPRLVDQLGILQETLGQVAVSVGISVPPSLTLPIGATAPVAPPSETAPITAKAEKTAASETAAVTASTAPTSVRVGEYNVATPAAEGADLLGGSAGLNLPGANNLGNIDQVAAVLQPLSGNQNDANIAFRAPGGFGAGSIIAPPAAQSALTRGPVERDSFADLAASGGPRTAFGEVRQFTVGQAGTKRNANSRERDPAAEAEEAQKQAKAEKAAQRLEDEKKSDISDADLREKMTSLANKKPKFKMEDYIEFRDAIAGDPGRVNSMAGDTDGFTDKAQTIFEAFAKGDTLDSTADRKKSYERFLQRQKLQTGSALNQGFASTPSTNDDDSTGERAGIERNSRPTGSSLTH